MAQDQMKLGPCPLCGWEAVKLTAGDFGQSEMVKCSNHWCGMGCETTKTWNRLSALAEQNRRRGEALERCRVMRERGDATGGHACLHSALLLEVEKICEEALK